MEVKPGSCIYILDDVISDELCETCKVIIDNTNGDIEDYGNRQNVKSKNIFIRHFENKKFAEVIDNEIYEVVKNILTKVSKLNTYLSAVSGDSGYCFRKISGATRLHIDGILHDPIDVSRNSIKTLRKLSVIIGLNEDYEGGDFHFPNQDVKIKLKKGQAIIFPPYWTHPHRTDELLNETVRYTINTWIFQ